ncbi:hypothetical protein [Pseudogemmobacter sonorensis]|uniref:hypothetical protein n=1 Tax=Pseudogemmobacter sonorensis TaxID=2989681 RepID=UPI0036B173D6
MTTRDISDMVQIRNRLRARLSRQSADSIPAHLPPIHSAFGLAMALNQIANRGHTLPGEMPVLSAAASMLFAASREGVL